MQLFHFSSIGVAAAAKSLQSCLTLCDPTNSSPPGSPVPRILRQEYWSGLLFPSPGDLPDPGKHLDPHLLSLAISGGFFTTKPLERLNEASALIFTDERA